VAYRASVWGGVYLGGVEAATEGQPKRLRVRSNVGAEDFEGAARQGIAAAAAVGIGTAVRTARAPRQMLLQRCPLPAADSAIHQLLCAVDGFDICGAADAGDRRNLVGGPRMETMDAAAPSSTARRLVSCEQAFPMIRPASLSDPVQIVPLYGGVG